MDDVAGFVLTGGHSTRMGQDKALLRFGDGTLVQHVAALVKSAAGTVTLIGAPKRYGHFGLPVCEDLVKNHGPLGGLYSALKTTHTKWNLLVACDMPGLTAEFLTCLLRAARESDADCLVPETASGLHPLCAVYHSRVLDTVEAALFRKSLKMHDLLSGLRVRRYPVNDSAVLENVNTSADWDEFRSTTVTSG
jgi:molybdenum cofactor guanylyltransferase